MISPTTFLSDLATFFFPRHCISCHQRLLHGEEVWCTSCSCHLPYTRAYPSYATRMRELFPPDLPLLQAESLFFFERGGKIADLLHAMKYRQRPRLCRQMGRILAAQLPNKGLFKETDILLPVPLHPKRMRQRGYNQSELLTAGIASYTHLPICTDALIRTQNNASQTTRSVYERATGTERLFALTPHAQSLTGKRVMLIDDVLTTGATLTACIKALSIIPDIRISIVTLAWAKHF